MANETRVPTDTRPASVASVLSAARQRGAEINANPQEQKFSYWEDPQRVARYRNFIRSQPPDWQPPEFMDKQRIEQAYQYMKFRNGDAPVSEWKMLPPDDPGVGFIRSMPMPPPQYQMPGDQDWGAVASQGQPAETTDPFNDWNNLHPWQQMYLGLFAPQPGLRNRPEWTRYTAAGGQALLAVPGGAAIGGLIGGPIGAAIGGGIAGIGTAYQVYTGQRVPVLGELLDLFNLLPMAAERSIGLVGQAGDQGLETILQNLPAAWEAANLTYETQQQDLLNLWAQLAGDAPAAADEVWQISRGIATPQKLTGPRGVEALNEARQRIAAGDDPLQVYQAYTSRFGDSGTFNDFIMQTVLDPSLVAEFGAAKIGGTAAHLIGQERLAAALSEGAGNPVIAALPMGVREIAQAVTHQQGPEGLVASIEKYRDWIQSDYFPAGTDRKPAAQLSDFEKWAGGLTAEGQIKALQPSQGKTGLAGWAEYINSLTPAAKAQSFMSMAHDNLNVLLSMANSDPERMIDNLNLAARQNPAEIARQGMAVVGSPVTATVAQALRDVLATHWDQEMLLRWKEAEPKRAILETIARNLGETVGELLDEYTANPEALLKRIEAKGGPAGTVEGLREVFDVFTGHDALPWNPNQFQAQLAVTMFDRMDQWLVQRYGLKPDPAIFRMSQTLKGMQSLLLLGLNPAYFINNMVNNTMTRAATGVFGYMTPRQITNFLDRFGITPERLGEAIGQTGEVQPAGRAMGQALQANDWIAKVQKGVTATNNKLGLFSRFSSWGEKIESSNAMTIGMLKFWDKSWKVDKGIRRMAPEVEALLDKQAPGVKDLIYRAAEAGLNMQEINRALFGEAIRPQVDAVIQDAARALFPDQPDSGVELLKATGVQARLEQLLEAARTPEQVSAAFDRVRTEVQGFVDEAHKREIVHHAVNIVNQIKAEGHAAILDHFSEMQARIARVGAQADARSWQRAFSYAVQTFAGMIKALDPDEKTNSRLLKLLVKAQKEFTQFDKERRALLKAYQQAEGTSRREVALKLDEHYRAYNQRAVEAASRIERLVPQRQPQATQAPSPAPEAAQPPDPRVLELQRLAAEYNLTDREGRPVLRYLMNVVNKRQPAASKYTDPAQVPLDVAEAALKDHQQIHAGEEAQAAAQLRLTAEDIIKQADQQAREAEIQANGMLTRRMVREQLAQAFGANDAETEAAMVLMDHHADVVARAEGHTPNNATRDAWYATRIAAIAGQGGDPTNVYNNYYQEAYGTLFAMHNLRADDLINANKLGGLPVPSIAVTKAGQPLQDYGEITLIGRRELVDPREQRGNRVFEADIYSPTKPRQVWAKVPSKKAEKFVFGGPFQAVDRQIGDYFTSPLWDHLVNSPDRNKALEAFENRATPKIVFLREKGIEVPIITRQPTARYEFSLQPALMGWLDAHYTELMDTYKQNPDPLKFTKTPIYKEFERAVHQAITERYLTLHAGDPAIGQKHADAFWNHFANPDDSISFTIFDRITTDYNMNKGPQQPDTYKIGDVARKLIKDNGLEREYQEWSRRQVDAVFDAPKLKLRGKLVDYTLNNIVEAMTSLPVRGSEDGMTFGPGRVRAQAAKEFESVQAMHKAENKLISKSEFEAAKLTQTEAIQAFQDDIISYADTSYSDTFGTLDDAMRALADYLKAGRSRSAARMERALEKYNFRDLDAQVIERAIAAAEAIVNMPTTYFEAKPQRVVHFDEFAGAVIPDDAPQAVRDILEARGIEYRTYVTEEERPAVIAEFYNKEGVLFQKASEGRANILKIKEMGFVPTSAVRQVFEGGTPAYTRGLIRFILTKRDKYLRGEMTVRDVAKAYLATVSSQGADALPWTTVKRSMEKTGIHFVRDDQPIDISQFVTREGMTEKIRPEELAGLWLWTDQGRAALDALERGEVTDAWRQYVQGREVFGRFGRGVKTRDVDGRKVPVEYPGEWFIRKGALGKGALNLSDLHEVTRQINEAKGDTAKINAVIQRLGGVSEGKTGFVGHMLGFGTDTVVDTQQANFWHAFLSKDSRMPPELTDTLLWGNWGKKGVINELKSMIEDVYWQLRAEGIGADIPQEAFTYVMHHWLWSVQKGAKGDEGTTHAGMYHALAFAQQEKGGVHFLRDGRAVIRALNAPDVSTIVHEIGHIFRRDLSQEDMHVVAQLGGLADGADLADLERRFQRGEIMPDDPEYQKYVQAEELFARGWERYLAEGDAPTPELRGIFQRFTDWMLQIYQRLRSTLDSTFRRQVSGFENVPEFDPGGGTVNIRAQVNGVSLRDIFDRLLVERRMDDGADITPVETAPPPGRQGPEADLVDGRMKDLPTQVQEGIKAVAQQLLTELESSRTMLLKTTGEEGGAQVDRYRREWEGPDWYKQLIEQDRQHGGKGDDLKAKYRSALNSIISGRDRANPEITATLKGIILDRALGQVGTESNLQPAILRYMGDNETLFSTYGERILNSEEPQLRAMFGDEWEKVLEEYLLWAADQEEAGAAQPIDTGEPVDILGEPAPAGELYQRRKPAQEAKPPVDLFGNPTEQPFSLEQQAQAETFNPQAQGQQGELFARSEYFPMIQAKNAQGSSTVQGTDEQPSLFQRTKPEGEGVPPGGTPAPEPFGSILDEITGSQVNPLLDRVKQDYLTRMQDRPVKFSEIDPQAQAGVKQWLKGLEQDMASTKYAAMRYGQQMRDAALLNYSRRYGFDQMMELVMPYQFWYTRSMIQWAKRMIDRPNWYGMYARLLQTQEKNAQNMPERLRGKMRLPAPWLPEWAGGGVWFDPVGKLLPFSTFGQPFEQYAQNADQVQQQAERALVDLVKQDRVTPAEAAQAKATRRGRVWDLAMAQASADQDKEVSPFNMLNMMITPSLFWTAGSNIASGHPEKINPLPITRTAGAVQTALQGTPLEAAGNVVGLLSAPERALRKSAGISEFGQWGDYYIDRELANMAADGTIDPKQAQIAMVERQGQVYDEAYRRVQYEQMLNVPGAAVLNQAARGAVIGTLQALPTAIFGGALFPEGELKLRGLADDFKRAYTAKDHGNPDALNQFFEDHPEYETRLALNVPTDQRLKQFLISELWNRYSSLEKPNRKLAGDQLGQDFKDAFLNKETRSYDSIPVETLARWNQMLGGAVPHLPETADVIAQPERPAQFYSPELAGKITDYQNERSEKYPNYYALQTAYYSIPETDKRGRKQFLTRFPDLPKYWDWNRQYKKDHPDMSEYWNAGSAQQAAPPLSDRELAQVDPVLVRQIMAWNIAGQSLTAGANSELQRLAKSKGVTAEQYARMILQSYLSVK